MLLADLLVFLFDESSLVPRRAVVFLKKLLKTCTKSADRSGRTVFIATSLDHVRCWHPTAAVRVPACPMLRQSQTTCTPVSDNLQSESERRRMIASLRNVARDWQ